VGPRSRPAPRLHEASALREAVLAFRRRGRRLGGNEPELVVLVLPEDREKTLDGFLVADQHYPAILGELYIGGIEVPLLRAQPDLVAPSSKADARLPPNFAIPRPLKCRQAKGGAAGSERLAGGR